MIALKSLKDNEPELFWKKKIRGRDQGRNRDGNIFD